MSTINSTPRMCVQPRDHSQPERTFEVFGVQHGDRGRVHFSEHDESRFQAERHPQINRTRGILAQAHVESRPSLRAAFGSTPAIPRRCRHILSTVTLPEAYFIADYLDIPQENILHFKARRFVRGSAAAALRAVSEYGQRHPHLLQGSATACSLTLIGHMFEREGERRFARLPVSSLFEAVNILVPTHLNLFSCNSASYHCDLVALYAAAGHTPPAGASFQDGVEVSPLFQRDTRSRRVPTLLYAGREIGPGVGRKQHLWAGAHRPILPYVVSLRDGLPHPKR